MTQNAETAKTRKERKKERKREREKKKKKKKWRCKLADPGRARPGRSATQAAARPRSPTPVSGFFFFFFFLSLSNDLMNTYSLWFFVVYFAVVVVVFFIFFLDVNRILETRFLGKYHVKKVPHQTWITHENRIPKTQFIDPKSSLLNSRC